MIRPQVLVLQHAVPETPGAIGEAIRAHGMGARMVRGFAGDVVPIEPRDARGLVVLGGPMGVHETKAHPFLKRELRLIESTLRAGLPVLGVCLGSQLLATVLGAKVRAAVTKEIGWFPVELEPRAGDDALFAGIRRVTPLHWHGDIFTLPRGALSLARSALTPLQSFRYDARTYGILFHMEVTVPMVRRAVRLFRGELDASGVSPDVLIRGAERHFAKTHATARTVFGRWVAMCA